MTNNIRKTKAHRRFHGTAPMGTAASTARFRFIVNQACAITLLFLLSATFCQAATVTASLDRDTITQGERATLSVIVSNSAPDQWPDPPTQPNLTIARAGSSRNVSIENGQRTDSWVFTYLITPAQPGDYRIPAYSVVVDKKPINTPPLRLKVIKDTPGPTEANGALKPAFLKLIVPKTTVYVGEVFPIEIQLYVINAKEIQFPQLQSEGFIIGQMPQPSKSQQQIRNTIYNVLAFKLTASAAKTGNLTLGPAQCGMILLLPAQRRSRDPNDPFDALDMFSPRMVQQQANITSDSVTIESLPLPAENRPANFTGAVGEFSMTASADPTNVTVGDPITLKIQIAGVGTLDSLSLPQFHWNGFKTYAPNSKITPTDPHGISGSKDFEQVVIPENSEVKEVPAIKFSYFDPDKKSYQTLEHPPFPITVHAAAAVQAPPTILANAQTTENTPPPNELLHIKPYLGTLAQLSPPLLRQPWFLSLQALPLLVLGASIVWRKRQEGIARNPRLQRRLKLDEFLKSTLPVLRAEAAAGKAQEFYALVFRVLQETIGEKLDLPSSSITESVLDDDLQRLNAPPELITDLREIFHSCNQVRYARSSSAQELNALVPKVEKAVEQLQALRKEEPQNG